MGAAGMGPSGLLPPCVGLAFAAAATSCFVTGFINPLSLYAQRVVLFDAQSVALTEGRATGQFYILKNRVVFTPATQKGTSFPGQKRDLFIYDPRGKSCIRVFLAGSARSAPHRAGGLIPLILNDVSWRIFDIRHPFASSSACPHEAESFNSGDKYIRLSDLLSFTPRGLESNELTTPELLSGSSRPARIGIIERNRIVSERIGRMLLCLVAPLFACAAACLTSRRMQYIVLPLACCALMLLHLGTEWIVRTSMLLHIVGLVTRLFFVVGAVGGVLVCLVWRLQNNLFRPQFGRA